MRSATPPHVPDPVDFSQYASKESGEPDKKVPEVGGGNNNNTSSNDTYVEFEYF